MAFLLIILLATYIVSLLWLIKLVRERSFMINSILKLKKDINIIKQNYSDKK